jgi:hypothetical protein
VASADFSEAISSRSGRVVSVPDLRDFCKRVGTGDWSRLIGPKRYAEELKRAGKDSPNR